MKKLILIAVTASTLFACAEQKSTTIEKEVLGYDTTEDGTKTAVYAGDSSSVKILEKILIAHNERDTATIRSLQDPKLFQLLMADGNVAEGTDNHFKVLLPMFATVNPRWDIKFIIASSFKGKNGEVQQWVTAGAVVTLSIDGQDVKVNQYYDALVVDGKLRKVIVAERKLSAGE